MCRWNILYKHAKEDTARESESTIQGSEDAKLAMTVRKVGKLHTPRWISERLNCYGFLYQRGVVHYKHSDWYVRNKYQNTAKHISC